MQTHKITIAIPTHDREIYLKECLISILKQTFQDFDILIFDSHSNYDIKKLIDNFADDRIKLIQMDESITSRKKFEFIFKYNFTSDYLIVFHDDDTMHPKLLEKEIEIFRNNIDINIVGSNLRFVSDNKKINNFKSFNQINSSLYDDYQLIRLILNNFNLSFSSIMYRVNILPDLQSYERKFYKWADRPLIIDIVSTGKAGIIKNKLVNYRLHPNQDSQADVFDKSEYIYNLLLYYKEKLPQPLSKIDKQLFFVSSTNNLILSGKSFSKNFKEYKHFIKHAIKKDLFSFKYINIKGVYYFIKVIFSFIYNA